MNFIAIGVDNISNKYIKDGWKVIRPYLLMIVNESIVSKRFLNKWKINKIIPLYKNRGFSPKTELFENSFPHVSENPATCSNVDEKNRKIELLEHDDVSQIRHEVTVFLVSR